MTFTKVSSKSVSPALAGAEMEPPPFCRRNASLVCSRSQRVILILQLLSLLAAECAWASNVFGETDRRIATTRGPVRQKVPDTLNSLVRVTYVGDYRSVRVSALRALQTIFTNTYNNLARFDPQSRTITGIQTKVLDSGTGSNYNRFVLHYNVQGTCLSCFETPRRNTFLFSQETNNQTNATQTSSRQRVPTRKEMFQSFGTAVASAVGGHAARLSRSGVASVLDLQEMDGYNCSVRNVTRVGSYISINLNIKPSELQDTQALESAVMNAYNNLADQGCDENERRLTSVVLLGGSDDLQTGASARARRRLVDEDLEDLLDEINDQGEDDDDSEIDMNSFIFEAEAACNRCSRRNGNVFSGNHGNRRLMDSHEVEVASPFSTFPSDHTVEWIRGQRRLQSDSSNSSLCTCPARGPFRAPTTAEYRTSLILEIAKIQKEMGKLLNISAVGNVTELVKQEASNETEEFSVRISIQVGGTRGLYNLTNVEKETLGKVIQRAYNDLNFATCDFPYFRRLLNLTYVSESVVQKAVVRKRDRREKETDPEDDQGYDQDWDELVEEIIDIEYEGEAACQGCKSVKTRLTGNFGNKRRLSVQLDRNLQHFTDVPGFFCPVASAETPLGGISDSQFRSAVQDTLKNVQATTGILTNVTAVGQLVVEQYPSPPDMKPCDVGLLDSSDFCGKTFGPNLTVCAYDSFTCEGAGAHLLNGTTLQCFSSAMTGTGTDTGITAESGTTIFNCGVTNFSIGIQLNGGDNLIQSVATYGNKLHGIYVEQSGINSIRCSESSYNDQAGLYVSSTPPVDAPRYAEVDIFGSSFHNNGLYGLRPARRTRMDCSYSYLNGYNGLYDDSSDTLTVTVSDSVFANNTGAGVFLDSSNSSHRLSLKNVQSCHNEGPSFGYSTSVKGSVSAAGLQECDYVQEGPLPSPYPFTSCSGCSTDMETMVFSPIPTCQTTTCPYGYGTISLLS